MSKWDIIEVFCHPEISSVELTTYNRVTWPVALFPKSIIWSGSWEPATQLNPTRWRWWESKGRKYHLHNATRGGTRKIEAFNKGWGSPPLSLKAWWLGPYFQGIGGGGGKGHNALDSRMEFTDFLWEERQKASPHSARIWRILGHAPWQPTAWKVVKDSRLNIQDLQGLFSLVLLGDFFFERTHEMQIAMKQKPPIWDTLRSK